MDNFSVGVFLRDKYSLCTLDFINSIDRSLEKRRSVKEEDIGNKSNR